MKDWKTLNTAAGLNIPDMDRISGALDALDAAFRPLAAGIPHDAEPALIFLITPPQPEPEA